MKVCKTCGKQGDDAFVACPYCGTPYEKAAEPATATTEATAEPVKEEATTSQTEAAEKETVNETATAATEGEATTETQGEEAAAEKAEKEEKSETVSLLAKTAFGKKAEKAEKKNHFIVNGIVALFSLLIFILTFFAGAKVVPSVALGDDFLSLAADEEEGDAVNAEIDFELMYGDPIGINQGTIDLIAGAFGMIETDKTKMAEYIEKASAKYLEALAEGFEKYEKDFEELEKIEDEEKLEKKYNKLMEKVASYAASKSGYNVVKVNYYMARLGLLQKSDKVNAYAGCIMAAILGVILLATLISTFVFTVLAVLALVKRKKFDKPFRALTLPLLLFLAAFATCCVNPIAYVNGVMIACVVLLPVSLLFLCAAKRVLLDDAETFTVKSLVRGGVSLLCALIAFFLLCGTLFNVKVAGHTVSASMGGALKELLRGAAAGGSDIYAYGVKIGDMAFMTLSYGLCMWICAVVMAAKCVQAAWHDLYTGKDEQENRKGKKTSTIGISIASAIFAVIGFVLTFITFNKCKLSIGVGIIFAIILLVGSAVIKGVFPSVKKEAEEE